MRAELWGSDWSAQSLARYRPAVNRFRPTNRTGINSRHTLRGDGSRTHDNAVSVRTKPDRDCGTQRDDRAGRLVHRPNDYVRSQGLDRSRGRRTPKIRDNRFFRAAGESAGRVKHVVSVTERAERSGCSITRSDESTEPTSGTGTNQAHDSTGRSAGASRDCRDRRLPRAPGSGAAARLAESPEVRRMFRPGRA